MLVKELSSVKKLVIAWDLDGTLIDSTHRVQYLDGKFDLDHWVANCTKEMIFKDTLLPLVEIYREFKKTGFTQICVTARKFVPADFEFLRFHGLEFDMILHRKDSNELDHILKNQKLQDFLYKEGRIPFMAYDDKQANLDIFDKFGFRTFQAVYMNEKLKADSYKEVTFKPSQF